MACQTFGDETLCFRRKRKIVELNSATDEYLALLDSQSLQFLQYFGKAHAGTITSRVFFAKTEVMRDISARYLPKGRSNV
jgi:hypothetical protein